MDVHSGTGTQILDLSDDSEETVAGPTDIDDDDNDDHGDGPSPSHGLPIIASGIPCDPPVTQEEEIKLDEGDLVENLNVSLSEGGQKNMVRVRQGIKTKMKPLS